MTVYYLQLDKKVTETRGKDYTVTGSATVTHKAVQITK